MGGPRRALPRSWPQAWRAWWLRVAIPTRSSTAGGSRPCERRGFRATRGVAGALFDGSSPTMVVTTQRAPVERRNEWARAGAQVSLWESGVSRKGLVPIAEVMEALGKRDMQRVLIEGGPTLAWLAVRDRVVDRFVLYLAPKLIGGERAPGVLGGDGTTTITGALPVQIRSIARIGDDVKAVADV